MCDYWMLDWSTHVNTFLTYKKKQLNAILWHKHILTAAHIWRENNWKTRKKPRARLKTFFLMYFPIKHHNECVDDWRRRWWRQLRRRLRLRHSNDDEQDNVHKRYMPTSFSHCSATDFYILTLFPQITSAHILFDCTQLSAQMEKKMHSPDFPRTHIFFDDCGAKRTSSFECRKILYIFFVHYFTCAVAVGALLHNAYYISILLFVGTFFRSLDFNLSPLAQFVWSF